MNILLLNYAPRGHSIRFPLGIGMIAAALREAKIGFDVADLTFELNREEQLLKVLSEKDYDVVGISSIIGNEGICFIEELIRRVKDISPGSITILGGAFPSSSPEFLLKHTAVDIVVIGEGEKTVIHLLRQIAQSGPLGEVGGITYKAGDRIVKTAPQPRIQDLDSLPSIPYELFPMDKYLDYINKTGRCFELTGSRGCYGNCSFCFKTFGRRVAMKSVQKMISEITDFREKYLLDRFNFTDDNFFNKKSRVIEFCERAKGLGIKYRFQCRVDFIDKQTAEFLASSGVVSLNFGIESPVKQLLNNVRKTSDTRQQEEAIHICQDAGIEVYASFIIGIPGETRESLEATYNFIVKNNLQPYSQINFLTPLPGTALYAECLAKGLIKDKYKYVSRLHDLYNRLHINLTDLADSVLIDFKNKRCNFKLKRNVYHEDYKDFLLKD